MVSLIKSKIELLNSKIINCKKCKRLVDFRTKIALEKRRQHINEIYWGKPVPGYGDINAKILILGLAPAAHGGNRTGRVFTGDKSADFLFKCLYKAKLSNLSKSEKINDGLILKNIFMTPVLKCVPPNDKPLSIELVNCFGFLSKEISYLSKIKVILTLGGVAFESCLKLFKLKKRDFKFKHGAVYEIGPSLSLAASYHPSPRNVNTGRIDQEMMVDILTKVSSLY